MVIPRPYSHPPPHQHLDMGEQNIDNSLIEPGAEVCQPVLRLSNDALSTKQKISSKFFISSTGLSYRWLSADIVTRWRYRLPIESWTPHYHSQFCVSFYFFNWHKIPYLFHRSIMPVVVGGNCHWMALQTSYKKMDTSLQHSVLCQLWFLNCPGSPHVSLNSFKWFLNNV